jgi:hypothetical protein
MLIKATTRPYAIQIGRKTTALLRHAIEQPKADNTYKYLRISSQSYFGLGVGVNKVIK